MAKPPYLVHIALLLLLFLVNVLCVLQFRSCVTFFSYFSLFSLALPLMDVNSSMLNNQCHSPFSRYSSRRLFNMRRSERIHLASSSSASQYRFYSMARVLSYSVFILDPSMSECDHEFNCRIEQQLKQQTAIVLLNDCLKGNPSTTAITSNHVRTRYSSFD